MRLVLQLALALVLQWRLVGIANAAAPEELAEMLRAGVRASVEVLNDTQVQVRETVVNQAPRKNPDGTMRVVGSSWERSELYARSGLKERVEPFPSPKNSVFTVSDDEFKLSFYRVEKGKDSTTDVGHATLEPANGGLLRQGVGIITGLFGVSGGTLPESVLANQKASIKSVILDGQTVYEVSAEATSNRMNYDCTYILSPARSFLPMRGEIREKDGTLRRRCTWDEYIQLADGQWFPKKVTQHWFGGRGAETYETQTHTLTADVVKQKPMLDADTFSTDLKVLPVGTALNDPTRKDVEKEGL